MKLEVGDRVTYKNCGRLYVKVIYDEITLKECQAIMDDIGTILIQIERPNWEVVKEKKELLTEEEREFLKQHLKFMEEKFETITKSSTWSDRIEIIIHKNKDGSGLGHCFWVKKEYFKNLELNRVYTLKELRIGGVNGKEN